MTDTLARMRYEKLKNRIFLLITALIITASIQSCATQEKMSVIESGPIKIQSVLINAILQDPSNWSGTVKAISVDGHDEIAQAINVALRNSGYSVPAGEARVTYSITELYAGPASDYVEKSGVAGSTAVKTGLSLATSVAVCATLNSCGSTSVIANDVTAGLNAGSVSMENGKGQNIQQLSGANLVVHKVCISGLGACASSAAVSSDPSVTLTKLRTANTEEGLLRTIRLKK